jgi:chaperonin GroES
MSKQKPKKTPKKVKKNKIIRLSGGLADEARIIPLGSRILIKPFTKEELTSKNSFGIILPDTDSKEKSEQGKVLAVGQGEYRDGKFIPVTVKIGDKVVFSKYGYEDVNVNGEELYLIKEENILAVLK